MTQWSNQFNHSQDNQFNNLVQLTPIETAQLDQTVVAKEVIKLSEFIQSINQQQRTLTASFNQHLLNYQAQYLNKPDSVVYAVAGQIRYSGEQLVLHFCQPAPPMQKFYASKLNQQQQSDFLNALKKTQMVTVYLSVDGKITAISPNSQQQCS
ncbi:hypothetical protein DS2_00510 [Catenovulum agarivorans DS-2]|uniref:Uncharacterized protein n=1 Tax=Catenovulum agarivorans DS-2 TaxID=1328313 RepID=W7QGU4_9ALTE|nr:hypothetical protein [Catenovulum agarivorans]EWH12159.1 hypothetical protein DS2_00510 [Catenovulum agarivorans DS-2]